VTGFWSAASGTVSCTERQPDIHRRRTSGFRQEEITRITPCQSQIGATSDSFLGVLVLSAKSARVIGRTALPPLHHPLSGFHTLSAVCSHPGLVTLFHATSAHRILVFRAFPSPSAVISLDIRCSPVVWPAHELFQVAPALASPCLLSCALTCLGKEHSGFLSRTSMNEANFIPDRQPTCAGHSTDKSGSLIPEGQRVMFTRLHPSPFTDELPSHPASLGVDFRALIRRRIRS
jgi:hypothetical protein